MGRSLRIARVLVPLLAAGLLVAIAVSQRGTAIVSAPAGGHGGTPIDPPRRLTDGAYASALGTIEALEAGAAALEADRARPQMLGSFGGVEFRAESESTPECATGYRALTSDEIARHQIPIPASLPSGAHEYETPFGSACGNVVTFIQRRFVLEPDQSSIVVIRWIGSKAVRAGASRQRVTVATIGGKDAVTVEPVTTHGYGNAWIFVHHGEDLLQVSGVNVRFDELRRVAEELS